MHGIAVVGVKNQRLISTVDDLLTQAGADDEIGCNGRILKFGEIPDHQLLAPNVDHQIETQPHALNGS